MLIDYERGWLALKKEIASKPSHGKRDLLSTIAEIEIACAVEDEGYDPSPPRRHNGNGKAAHNPSQGVMDCDAQLSTPLDDEGVSYGTSLTPHPART